MSDRLSTLSPDEKRRLLARMLEEEAAGPERFPLSFGQQRLWFLDQFEPGNPAYNNWLAVRLLGDMDKSAVQAAVEQIVDRHEALRTTFQSQEGEPYQEVSEFIELKIAEIDLSRLDDSSQHPEVLHLARSEAALPFDLSQGPLIRFRLLHMAPGDNVLLICIHHIVSDAWSLGILIRELATLYGQFAVRSSQFAVGTDRREAPQSAHREGRVDSPSIAIPEFQVSDSDSSLRTANRELLTALPPLPIQYPDYAVWQREELQSEVLESHLDYWRKDLAGDLPALELPLDRPRPLVQTTSGAALPVRLPAGLMTDFKAVLQRQGATLFMGLLAALQVLLHRYSGQDDILVGTPVANRPRVELEGLIGLFVNTLVLRSDLGGDPPFDALLRSVRDKTLAAFDHQEVPFERVVEELQPERDMSRSLLFQVQFVLQSADLGREYKLPGLSLRPFPVDDRTSQYDFTLDVSESPTGLRGWIRYNRDLFDRSSMIRLAKHFGSLIASIAAQPQQTVSRLRLLGSSERHQLLCEWGCGNDCPRPFVPLHRQIDQQSRRTPDAIALEFEDSCLSYAELERLSSSLARYLHQQGIGLECRVPVLMERSLELPLAHLSVLKAGAAYLPLDPDHPSQRLNLILEDTLFSATSVPLSAPSEVSPPPPLLLTQHHLADKLDTPHISLDTAWPSTDHQPLSAPVPPNSAAYLLFTSGSTGRPKGTLNTHEGILNRLLSMQDQYRLTSYDRLLQKAPYTFDVSVREFFWPLMTGACLVIARPEGHKDSGYLVDTVIRQQVTVMHIVPSMLQAFLEQPGVGGCRSLRFVPVGGEALTKELQDFYFERLDCPLDNLYGPTEAAVDVTVWPCRPSDPRRNVPIGRPIDNLSIRILDRCALPVPINVPGELHIGGIGLGRGYERSPGLTAEKFIPDPFSWKAGARLYRSGDRARFLPGGEIEFLGRIDFQVKLRGLRIELGEIEAVMRGLPGVEQAVVVMREGQLIGYVSGRIQESGVGSQEEGVVRDTSQPTPRPSSASSAVSPLSIRNHLQERLPEYMIPAQIVLLDEFPLTTSGKLDRKRLPAAPASDEQAKRTFAEPQTPTQVALAEMWAELLPVERVGLEDDFFVLGGHSLMATRLNARVEKRLRVRLTLRKFFQHSTLGALADLIDQRRLPEDVEDEELNAILDELEGLSDDEVNAILEESKRAGLDGKGREIRRAAKV